MENKRNIEGNMQEAEVLHMNANVVITPPLKRVFGEIGLGAISAKEATDEQATEYGEAIRDNYLVATNKSKPSCCIDGRGCAHTLAGEQHEPGPKVAGGNLISAYAAAELAGWFEENDPQDVEGRVRMVGRALRAGGLSLGGHCDTAAKAVSFEGKTGCGANDKFPEIISNIANAREFIVVGGKTLIDEGTYKSEFAEGAVHAATVRPAAEWNIRTMITEISEESSNNIEVLIAKDDPTHGHAEQLVIWNNVKNTTVDRDKLLHDDYEQVFVVDAWYIKDIADVLARGPQAVKQRDKLIHALTAYQLGTYATLCDGSHRVAVIG